MLPAHYQKDKPGYFCRFTFGQFFTLLVLEVFTLFFIFYLGARYGRSLLGIETPPTLAESKGLPEVKVTDPNVVVTTSDPEIKELAKDILEQAPTADLKQRVAEMLQESGEKRTTDQKKGTTDYGLRTTDKEKRTTDQGLGTRDRKPETEEPHKVITQVEPVIRTGPKAPFAIQVGAYTNPDEAHHMVSHWKQKGYPAYLASADIPGKGRWYRVRLGGFDSKKEAKSYLEKFRTQEGVDAFIAPSR